jgi:hypothetical protein
LVWAATELLVEQMKSHAIFEFYRQKAETLAAAEAAAERGEGYVPKPVENQLRT